MSMEELNNVKAELYAINEKDIRNPSIPVDVAIQETKDLYVWCQKDKPKLIDINIPEELIESLEIRARVLRVTESMWLAERFNKEESLTLWKEQSIPAYELRNKIIHCFNYAYRDNPLVQRRIKIIGTGKGPADMIQDLSDMATLGRDFYEELQTIKFDMSLLDKAEELAESLSNVLAEARAREGKSEMKELRDRAYTYLKMAVDKIRSAGQYLFYQDHDRLVGYRSQYVHMNNINRKKAQQEKTAA